MFGFGRKKGSDKVLNDALAKITEALTNDDLQLRLLGPQNYSVFKNFSAIDKHSHGEGEFGYSLDNPIPTNGPIGSLAYLSQLTTSHDHRIVFHRFTTLHKVDVYEFVSLSGVDWGFLFVDMYHSRKSSLIPKGFLRSNRAQQLSGFNHFWDDFPLGYSEQKSQMNGELRFLYAAMDSIAREMSGRDYSRPHEHYLLGEAILAAANQ